MKNSGGQDCTAVLASPDGGIVANMFGSGFSGKYFGLDAKGQFTTDLLRGQISGGYSTIKTNGEFTAHWVN